MVTRVATRDSGNCTATAFVLDTNIVLDIWLFSDARSAWLLPQLTGGVQRWLATAAMREELARVLGYPRLVRQLEERKVAAHALLAAFDQHAYIVVAATPAPMALKCKDADDQKFIDLAWAHGANLISRDAAVLAVLERWQKPDLLRYDLKHQKLVPVCG